ncbi:MAG: hypothetical protein CK424_07900 [Legionella sp.]|nr:MAG: hypothetical protein CK424_07900 [Legionella sp.]
MKASCYLVGEDSLLIQCANILLKKGHRLNAIISPLPEAKNWSNKNGILYYQNLNAFLEAKLPSVDYIFSIVNSHILSKEIIKLATNSVINYHDSLLPKYAGLNSTTWAILNSEVEHGVSWHLVDEKIDAGDIVKQVKVAILDDDTAFTLNLRCYEQAITSFEALIVDIETNNLQRDRQDLKHRSYYGLAHQLPNLGFIDWANFSGLFIAKLNRSLIFNHHYNNNIGSLKIYLSDDYIIPFDLEFLPEDYTYNSPPGQILAISQNEMEISVIDGVLRIKKFLSKHGKADSIESVVSQYNLKVGCIFSNLQKKSISMIGRIYSDILKSERYWLSTIKEINEHSIFFSDLNKASKKNLMKLESSIELCRLQNFRSDKKEKFLLTSILIYLYRLNNYDKFSIFISGEPHKKLAQRHANLFSLFMPLNIHWSSRISLAGALRSTGRAFKLLRKNYSYFTDISVRHPDIQNISLDTGIFINMNGGDALQIPKNAILFFNYIKEKNKIDIYHKVNLNNKNSELKELINNIAEHISTITNKLVDNPHIKISSFCFLTQLEKDKVLRHLNHGETKILPQENIVALIDKHVQLFPNNPAVIMKDLTVSYKMLWDMSDKVAHFIRVKKIKANSLIGLYVERNVDMFAIILGILKADCVYVPLDTRYPMMKIETISNIADLSWMITSNKFINTLEHHFKNKQTINICSIEKILSSFESYKINYSKYNPSALAYIMFTSGTTGEPKGVMVTQQNVINYCLWFLETTRFTFESIIDFSSSIAFDLSVPCTIAPLLVGGKIVICNEETKINPESYLKYLIKHQISHVELTPGYLEMLLNYPLLISELNDLKVVLLGADILPVRDVIKWSNIRPDHQIVNEYGPTETTVSATSYFIDDDIHTCHTAVPIGKPAYNTTCYVLDKYENVCPLGMRGELYIGGAQVSNGYLGKPMLTKDKFVSTTIGGKHDVIYKTGDLVSWLPNGHLQFFRRNDLQVKIHGYRVELSGIEATLLKIPQVQQAVVLPKNGHFKEKYLSAYLVLEHASITVAEIKNFLLAYLPSYMIPKELHVVDDIPLKQNEKIDFERLLEQENKGLSYDDELYDSLDEFESNIMKIWKNAFHHPVITMTDNFFDIGGSSFIALQIISELKNYYKIDIPLSYLFEYPSIELISKKIKEFCFTDSNVVKKIVASTIIKLSNNSHGIPLFLIHPVGGSVFWYKQLANYLDEKYIVYGVQDISIEGQDLRFLSLEEMATYYLDKINQQLQTHCCDEYHIAGASFGATVAFEIAHQLLKQNKHVSFLGLLDGWAKYPHDLMQINTHELLQHSDEKQQDKLTYLSHLDQYRQQLLLNYHLYPLNTNVFLFKASELWSAFIPVDDRYNGWKPFINGEIEVYITPGNHETMFFGENVSKLAAIVRSIDIMNKKNNEIG